MISQSLHSFHSNVTINRNSYSFGVKSAPVEIESSAGNACEIEKFLYSRERDELALFNGRLHNTQAGMIKGAAADQSPLERLSPGTRSALEKMVAGVQVAMGGPVLFTLSDEPTSQGIFSAEVRKLSTPENNFQHIPAPDGLLSVDISAGEYLLSPLNFR